MKIHHLSCGCMCPIGGKLFDGVSPVLGPATLVCHCLLVETGEGLVLVDTGFGMGDVKHPARNPAYFRLLNRPQLQTHLTARAQIEELGFRAEDVRHIVLTHLDFDHAGGIADFPGAQIHLSAEEFAQSSERGGFIQNRRYVSSQLRNSGAWNQYRPEGDRWFGFEAVRSLRGLPPEIALIPLAGHTRGHCGVAVKQDSGRWLLLAGDAYFHHQELVRPSQAPVGARIYERMMDTDRRKRAWNQQRLRHLLGSHGGEVEITSSHDHSEFDRLRLRQPREKPVEREGTPRASIAS